jgi:hypothetical protein
MYWATIGQQGKEIQLTYHNKEKKKCTKPGGILVF